ncbi:MAG: HD domain-containing phosphohydrolase [bacterium]
MKQKNDHYHSLFEHAPVGLMELDFSLVRNHIKRKWTKGIKDIDGYFNTHPRLFLQFAKKIRILLVNKRILRFYKAKTTEDLYGHFYALLNSLSCDALKKTITAVAKNKHSFHGVCVTETLTGVRKEIMFKWIVYPGYEKTMARTLVSFVDITDIQAQARELSRINMALTTISECNQILVRTNNEADLTQQICEALVQYGGYKMAWVGYAESDEHRSIRPIAHAGFEEGYLTQHFSWGKTKYGHGPTASAIRTRKHCVINDIPQIAPKVTWADRARQCGYTSVISLPLIHKNKALGAFTVFSTEKKAFHKSAVKLLKELANDMAFGIENLRVQIERDQMRDKLRWSLEKLETSIIDTVHALASLVSKRDPYTSGHQERVTNLAIALAEEMGLTHEQIKGIQLAGLLHDIGKIAVPAEILSKPCKLTISEFAIIQTHPQIAYDILKGIDFPWSVAETVWQHHERLNGSGYPHHLEGTDIKLEARILGVADVVEAMTSHRPYRPALGINVALAEINKKQGVLYDRDVVCACLALFRKKKFKFV